MAGQPEGRATIAFVTCAAQPWWAPRPTDSVGFRLNREADRRGRADLAAEELGARSVREPLLVQRFEPGITEGGEWSVVYLGGERSHSVLKRPGPGDFRVQEELGGSARPRPAPERFASNLEQALEST